jgi:hypothetical protein
LTHFVKENIEKCESVCYSSLNLIAFLINCHGVSINYPHLYNLAVCKLIRKHECGPSLEKVENPWLIRFLKGKTLDQNIATY